MNRFVRRVAALVVKETRQVFRDPSSLAIGVVLPLVLILLFGYGLSLDVKNIPVAVVLEESSGPAMDLAARFELSPYFKPVRVHTMAEAEELMLERKIDGIVRVWPDFAREVERGQAKVQVLLHGTDANRARIMERYIGGAVGQWAESRGVQRGPVVAVERMWFNEANDSHYFLVPGLIMLVMTLIGAFLTALVVAREWERGTLESLFVTPVRAGEILLGKMIPYFGLGIVALTICLAAGHFMFHVPLRGSLAVLVAISMVYLLVALGIGLLISTVTKNQFVAVQLSLIVTFLPSTLLSGFIFDLRSMPTFVRGLTYLLPARYYVACLQTIYLAGDVWSVILPNLAVLAVMATLLLSAARLATKKQLV